MTREDISKAIHEELEDSLDRVIVAIRASHPSAQDIKNLAIKLDNHIITHERDNKSINDKLDPIAKAYANVTGFRATIITASSLLLAGWGGYEVIKRIAGK